MKLRVQGGVNGYIGVTEFKDGVSVGTVTPRVANLLRAVMSGVEILEDDGETVDEILNSIPTIVGREIYENVGEEAPSVFLPYSDGTYKPTAPALTPEEHRQMFPEGAAEQSANAEVQTSGHTREALEKIADEKGIAGLREIGEKLNVKANSITKLIDAILGAQADGKGQDAEQTGEKQVTPPEGPAANEAE